MPCTYKLFSWKPRRPPPDRVVGAISVETACQRRSGWCVACCGLHNLDVPAEARLQLAEERSVEFGRVDLGRPDEIAGFRRRREAAEDAFPRRDEGVYVCPFLGKLDAFGRLGCLLHPGRTGIPDSQRHSFYGAAICASYDCPVKEADDGTYASLLSELFPGSLKYGRLVADHAFYSAVRRGARAWSWLLEDARARRAFEVLCEARLRAPASEGITSFEIRHRFFDDSTEELLGLLGEVDDSILEAARIVLDTVPGQFGPSA